MIERLQDIGFYTLCDDRARNSSSTSPMYRCEMILTNRCNFNCPYCRGLREELQQDMSFADAMKALSIWIKEGLKNVRFSGGEPTVYRRLNNLVRFCKKNNVERIAVSTNGSMRYEVYEQLLEDGVNDFSISLDACCSSFGDQMTGVIGKWEIVVDNIRRLSKETYVTVGTVLTQENIEKVNDIVNFAHGLGVADIRVIPAAQFSKKLTDGIDIEADILDAHPILKYRINNMKNRLGVRGLNENDCRRCYLIKDDSAVAVRWHYPCVIYLREGGDPIGEIGKKMRKERIKWVEEHDIYEDKICRNNCLDCLVDYNNKAEKFLKGNNNDEK